MNSRAQSSIEFMMLVGAVLFFFTTLLGSFAIQNVDNLKDQRNEEVKEIAWIVQDEINLAKESYDGYSRNFTLPLKVAYLDYSIQTKDNAVFVKTDNNEHAIALSSTNVTGDPKPGANYIRKKSGIIFINQ